MSSAFGGSRQAAPRPPEKGVFPLDHFNECKEVKDKYMACLAAHGDDAAPCAEVAKAYLTCRMDRNLMARQDLADLGIGADGDVGAAPNAQPQPAEPSPNAAKRATGFVAGVRRG